MAESREVQIAEALGIKGTAAGTNLKWQDLIRQRVRELLEQQRFCYYHKRIHGEGNKIVVEVEQDESSVFDTGWFADSDLSKNEQNLLLWLATKGEKVE